MTSRTDSDKDLSAYMRDDYFGYIGKKIRSMNPFGSDSEDEDIADSNTDEPEITKSETVDEMRKKVTVRGLSGLRNLGNTCYMNSILQCLTQLSAFCAYLRLEKYQLRLQTRKASDIANLKRKRLGLSENENVDIPKKQLEIVTGNTIVNRLSELFKAMWKNNYTISPKTFKDLISNTCPTFRGYTQNDSQELLSLILDRIHEETKSDIKLHFNNITPEVIELINYRNKCLATINDSSLSLEARKQAHTEYNNYRREHFKEHVYLKAYGFWKKYIKNNHSIITDLFTGLFYSEITCTECSNISTSFEPFTIISIPTKDNIETSLDECLTEFSKEEILSGDNKYQCTECNKKVDAKKKLYIWESPEILIIHLKRFKNEGSNTSKTNSTVKFPLYDLQLNNNYSEINKMDDHVYDLKAISEHTGTCNHGHYVAHCKNDINNKWYEFNDERVMHVPDEKIAGEIVTKNAYILIYEKRYISK